MNTYNLPTLYIRTKIAKQRYAALSRRGIEWTVSSYHLEQMVLAHPYCAISGEPLVFEPNYVYSASIDRIDSDLGYVPGNCQWVGASVNQAKNVLDHDQFRDLCASVTKNHNRPRHYDPSQLALF